MAELPMNGDRPEGHDERSSPSHIQVVEGPVTDLASYSEIPISFLVEKVLAPVHLSAEVDDVVFEEVPQVPPYLKDYDAIPGAHPTEWPARFDTSGWVLMSAWLGPKRVGGVVLAHGGQDETLWFVAPRGTERDRSHPVPCASWSQIEMWKRLAPVWALGALLLTFAPPQADLFDRVEHHYADSDGTSIHYVTLGAGPLVVMIHGFPDFWYTWRDQMRALTAEGYRVAAMDTRGYNRSGQPESVEEYAMPLLVGDVAAAHTRRLLRRASPYG